MGSNWLQFSVHEDSALFSCSVHVGSAVFACIVPGLRGSNGFKWVQIGLNRLNKVEQHSTTDLTTTFNDNIQQHTKTTSNNRIQQ